jgi:flagellar hook protein FlgE
MSLFGAMNTAISGLTAQSGAFTNISDNVANSQTVGYKQVDTAFKDYLTTSDVSINESGSVIAIPQYMNNVQGTVTQSNNPLALAISGQGFFPVSQATTNSANQTSFNATPYYTRTGDFQMNANGYMVNSAGMYLNGWTVNPVTGSVNQSQLAPIQVAQSVFNPVATSQISLSANLPATPTAGTPISTQVTVYDGLGTAHAVNLTWTQNASNDWTVAAASPDDTTSPAVVNSADVKFGATSGNPVANGTVGSLGTPTGSVTTTSYGANAPANVTFTMNFGQGAQSIALDLGTFGAASGLTQYAGTTYALNGLTQNGLQPGSFSSISTNASGDISANYSNGQSQVIAKVPLITFADPNGLQSQNGQAYTMTTASGIANIQSSGSNGAGTLVTGSVEASNVDIASEFSKLIVAQQAYSANTKLVTTADQLLQETINMKQ